MSAESGVQRNVAVWAVGMKFAVDSTVLSSLSVRAIHSKLISSPSGSSAYAVMMISSPIV